MFISVDFPEPETPVIQLKSPHGKRRVTFFRLFPEASSISMNLFSLMSLRFLGVIIFLSPLRNCPVIDSGLVKKRLVLRGGD